MIKRKTNKQFVKNGINNKSIAFVTHEPPSLRTGATVRNYNLIKNALKNGYEVRVFSISSYNDLKDISLLHKYGKLKIHTVKEIKLNIVQKIMTVMFEKKVPYMKEYELSGLDQIILKEIQTHTPSIIILEQLSGYIIVKNILNQLHNLGVKSILDAHNVEYIALNEGSSAVPLWKRAAIKYLIKSFKKEEIEAIRSCNHLNTCSENDKEIFSKYIPKKNISVIPNGVDCEYYTPTNIEEKNSLLYMGTFAYPPNQEAMLYFLNDIYPLIKEKIPSIKVNICGSNPPLWLIRKGQIDKNIIVHGYVTNLKWFLNNSSVCICPLKGGSGTRLKILEYMASGKPIVSTSKGAEGLDFNKDVHLFLANNAKDFSEATIRLLKSSKLRKKLGKNCRKLVKIKYSWDTVFKNLEQVIKKLGK